MFRQQQQLIGEAPADEQPPVVFSKEQLLPRKNKMTRLIFQVEEVTIKIFLLSDWDWVSSPFRLQFISSYNSILISPFLLSSFSTCSKCTKYKTVDNPAEIIGILMVKTHTTASNKARKFLLGCYVNENLASGNFFKA